MGRVCRRVHVFWRSAAPRPCEPGVHDFWEGTKTCEPAGTPPEINGRYTLTRPGLYTHDVLAVTQQQKIPTAWQARAAWNQRGSRVGWGERFSAVFRPDNKPGVAVIPTAAPIPQKDCRFTFACQKQIQQIQAHWSIMQITRQQGSQLTGLELYHSKSELTTPDSVPPPAGWQSAADQAQPQFQCWGPSPLTAAVQKLQQMPQASLLFQMTETSVSFAVVVLNCAVFLFLMQRRYGYEDVGCSFDRVVIRISLRYWTTCLSSLLHLTG